MQSAGPFLHGDEPAARATAPAKHPERRPTSVDLVLRNEHDLARAITTEAGGEAQAAMTAVGWTLRNRMIRDGSPTVRGAWRGCQHGHAASSTAVIIAQGIMTGSIADPTAGATHFHTPRIMPKKAEDTGGIDVGGGLESVADVTEAGKPVQNHRPGWALSFDRRIVANVPEASFKFHRQPGTGRVR